MHQVDIHPVLMSMELPEEGPNTKPKRRANVSRSSSFTTQLQAW